MILVTGATGFVGRTLISNLLTNNYQVTALVRQVSAVFPAVVRQVVGDIQDLGFAPFSASPDVSSFKDVRGTLTGVDVLVHCAARVHIMNDLTEDPLEAFRAVNTYATLNLAKQAAEVGVKRFVFLSSIKVNGEMSDLEHPFTPDDDYIPTDPYGLSKYEAEQGLLAIAKETGMEVVIIRPPLVYGPGVKANFASMMKWMNKSIPLPFGAIHNRRSLVALDNLVSFISHCADYTKTPQAANQVFLISDGEDVSTTELLQKVAKAFGKKALLLPVPVNLMTLAAKLLGKGDVTNRLFGSLQVDSSKARELLGWNPIITMDEQLKKTADAYLEHEKTL